MRVTRILCPDCGTSLPAHIAYAPGQMVDCPHCRLLFVVTSKDAANFDESPAITDAHYTDLQYGNYAGSIAPTEARRRRPGRTPDRIKRTPIVGMGELFAGLVAGLGLLILAGTVIGVILSRRGLAPEAPPAPSAPAVAPVEPGPEVITADPPEVPKSDRDDR